MTAVDAIIVRILVNGHTAMSQLMFAGDKMAIEVETLEEGKT